MSESDVIVLNVRFQHQEVCLRFNAQSKFTDNLYGGFLIFD